MAFAGRAKGFAALADSSVSGQGTGSDIAMDVDGFFEGRKEGSFLQVTLVLFVRSFKRALEVRTSRHRIDP